MKKEKTLGVVTYENGNYTFLSARELREHARYVSGISAGIFGTENKINLYKGVLNKLSRRQRLLKKYPSLGKEVIPVFNPNNRRGLSTTARRLPLLQA